MADSGKDGPMFPALQIAKALGISRQAVFQQLAGTPPDCQIVHSGRQVNAWSIESLPGDMKARLEAKAATGHYRSAVALLSEPPRKWTPAIPLRDVAAHHIEKATQLQRALRAALAQINEAGISDEQIESLGLNDYQAAFGFRISAKHFWRLLNRTLDRDGGAGEWDRLDLYLDNRLSQKIANATTGAPDSACIRAVIAGFRDPAKPTLKEKALLWCHVFEAHEAETAAGRNAGESRRDLVRFLEQAAPFIAKSQGAIGWAWRRKFQAWAGGGKNIKALLDKRPAGSGWKRSPEIGEQDRLTILRHIKACGFRIAQGWREAIVSNELSAGLMTHYLCSGSSKYHVPSTIRDLIRSDVKAIEPWAHGPHAAKLAGAYVERDWSTFAAGDWFQGDDTTLPVYWWEEGKEQNPTRGQFLAMIDFRSTKVLAFVLISDKSYNARDVRNLMSTTHDAVGLPRVGFYYENGPWRSRIIEGVSWSETEIGLRSHGLKFVHARGPQAKIVERVFGAIQTRMERDLGYIGRDERHDRYERVQKELQSVRSGKRNPSEFFYHRDEWCDRLEEICQQYNSERQEGDILQGRSPDEGFQEWFSTPLRRFDSSTRYLLANYKLRVKVGRNGISFRFGKERFTYKNETTGQLLGRELLAWFSPEEPGLLSVSDLDEEIPFTVERAISPPAVEASEEELGAAIAQVEAHNAYGKRLFRIVNQDSLPGAHRQLSAPAIVEAGQEKLGEIMEQQRADSRRQQEGKAKEEDELAKLAGQHEVSVPSNRIRQKALLEYLRSKKAGRPEGSAVAMAESES